MWMFVLLSPSTGRGHSHGVLSTQYLIHFVIKAVWFGPTPFDHSHPTLTHPILMTRLKLWQKEKKSLWTEAETQAKRRICKLELKSFTQQVFSTNQRFRVGYKQGWFHQRCSGYKWSTVHSLSLIRKSEYNHGTNNIPCLQPQGSEQFTSSQERITKNDNQHGFFVLLILMV